MRYKYLREKIMIKKENLFFDVNTTKGKILNVACKILENKNYQAMTTKQIAKMADISEGTIYRYFTSKKEILLTILDELNNYFIKIFFSGIENAIDYKEKLMTIGENFFIHKDKLASLYSIIFKVFSEVSDDEVKNKFKQIYEKILMHITNLLFAKENFPEEKENLLKDRKIDDIEYLFSTYFLWGAGELLWKLDIVSDGNVLNREIINKMLMLLSKIIEIEREK